MKKEKLISLTKRVLLLLLLTSVLLVCAACGGAKHAIVVEGELAEGDTIEYTGGKIQFPVAYVADQQGKIISYNVMYKVINLADQSELTDEYAAFDLKPGAYQIIYTYGEDDSVSKTVSFDVVDTTAPAIEFIEIPNGLFLQDITEDSVNKLPLYSMEDASSGEGIDLQQTLKFKGAGDADFKEQTFRKINNSYEIDAFGTFLYELTATDCYGNTTTVDCQWKVKDRTWKPEKMPADGILADYSEEGYCNLVEGGDVNQYYKIDNDYSDTFLPEFEGAKGVMKIEMGFNNAAGYGNNTIRLRVPKTYTKEDLEGKYLAVRIYVEGEHLKNTFLFGGNNVAFRDVDATTRAFTADMAGLETGKWMTFYLEAAAVENIGMYPNATYNPDTTFYEGGDPGDSVQLCFHRESGYFNDMTLYIDSISIAELLPDTTLTIDGDQASWTAVEGAVGYRIVLNGKESVTTKTSISLPGEKGYIRVTPMGDGVLTLDAQTVTGVYGLDPGDSVAKFDDPLYAELFNDRLRFSTDAEHNGYRPKSFTATMTEEGLRMDIATGAWGVVSGIRFQFPEAQEKGDNTTLILNMKVSGSEYGQIRVYDYAGKQLGVIKLDESNTGKFCEHQIDISAYTGKMEGIQLIFGPNSTFTSVNSGVSITFKEISLKNTYYPIWVDGQYLMCAGTRKLTPGYTNKDVVQFTTFFNFKVGSNDTPLNFSGTVRLDGKKVQSSALTVVGYPDTDTICFKVPHSGKILTIMEGSVIYYDGIAVEVEETFNARWNGSSWEAIAQIPPEPDPEYVTLADGSVKRVENKMELEAGHTGNGVVQFLNVYDFGVGADDTPLGFEGTVMLDGEIVRDPRFVGYPSNTTIALKEPHQGKLLTIMQGSVIYYGDTAVVVSKTFNAIWNGSYWSAVSSVPPIPEPEYVTLADGITREVMAKVTLTPGYTQDNLVQFPDIYDFGAPADSTPIGFEGTVLLQGREVENPTVTGYKDSKTIGLENLNHKGKVVTIKEGAIFYNDTAAVKVKTTFNAMWDGTTWTPVAEIPEPEPPHEGPLTVQYRDGDEKKIRVNTNILATTPIENFLATDNGCNISQSGAQQVGWIGMTDEDGTIVLTFHFNDAFAADEYYLLAKDSVFGFTDGSKYTLDKDYLFTWNGSSWALSNAVPEPSKLEFEYRYGTNNLIQINTNLPVTTPTANFLASDNGCNIGQTGDQSVGWVGMENVDGTIVLSFHFNGTFETGQYYALAADSIFGFTNGKTYPLDKGYVFTWNGSSWTVTDTAPAPSELELEYRYGANNLIQVNTNLPATTPCVNFTAGDNGCVIDQSANLYQQMGWVGMDNVDGTIVLTFHFNSNFMMGQDYILPAGSVFGFTDGKTYPLDQDYVFSWDGSNWTVSNTLPTFPALSLQYYTGANNLIGVATNLPATTPTGNYFDYANGSKIVQSGDQQMYGFAVVTEQGQMGLAFSFSNGFEVGQHYVLAKDSVFGFGDGNRYKLDKDYVFIWNGTKWLVSDTVPDPAPTELNFAYRYGTNNQIQVNTNLPVYTPTVSFTAGDNGCNIDQSVNLYQQMGWVGMDNVDDTIVLTFHFNSEFKAGQDYILPAGSVFGFTDGKTYPLDKNYVFSWDGSNWSVSNTMPTFKELSLLQYYTGDNKLIGVATNLPATTPLGSFAVDANGSKLSQSGDHQMNGFVVAEEYGVIGLGFSFTDAFEVGEYCVLAKDSVFGFGDGTRYKLDKDYVFTWNGAKWVISDTVPAPAPAKLEFTYKEGGSEQIKVKTNLPSYTNCANFLAGDNGCVIDQSGNPYQQVGYIGMENVDGTIVLAFNFNNEFKAGEYYILPAGSVFGFTGGMTFPLDKTYVFVFDGSSWSVSDTVPTLPVVNLSYYDGSSQIIGLATDLPSTTPTVDFTAGENGCVIDQSANLYQQVDKIGMVNQGGTIGLLFNFGSEFKAGQNYILRAGSVFGFTDGSKYTLDKDYVFTWNGSSWVTGNTIPEPTVGFGYRYGTNSLIQVNTNLPSTTPIANFGAGDNGCVIDQSGNQYQQVGWIGMDNADGTIVLTFNFNAAFSAGQNYILPAGSVFGFTDGKTYKLDKDYVFSWDGSSWDVSDTVPTPAPTVMNLQYYAGMNNLIGLATDLPATTPLKNFLATENGCNIDQSANLYQQVGSIEMVNQGGIIGLIFHFNSEFKVGQNYILPEGAVFGFTDGKTYTLDKTYVFTWNGSSWEVGNTIPEPTVGFAYRYGTNSLIQVNTNLPATTPIKDFTATENGSNITQSGDQNVGWIGMADADGTVVLTFNFGSEFTNGQYYKLEKGSVFGFTNGKTYKLDKDYVFVWDGTTWTVTDTVPTPPEPEQTEVSFEYRYGTSGLFQVNTNLPATTPIKDFTATENGSNITQSGNQSVGWIGMADADGTVVLTFNFGSEFTNGQYYKLEKGSVFGFTNGKTYELDKDYVFSWDGSNWSVSDTIPAPEPVTPKVSFAYRYGTENLIQINTDLPASTPCVNFTTGDNGCSIDQSANQYQQVGWIGMDNVDDTIVLTFHFGAAFTAGQNYVLPAGAVFGFTDGSSYVLDANYTFTWDGSNWAMAKSE